MTRKLTLVAAVAVLAMGTSAALAFGGGGHATDDAVAAQETTTTPGVEATVTDGANVTFTNQTSDGTVVEVDSVVVPEGGFAVIHAAENVTEEVVAENETEFEGVTQTQTTVGEVGGTQGYATGEVLGNSTYLDPGTHEDVTVRLDEPLEEGQVLVAMAHRDTNDNQQYEFPEADGPYTEDDRPVTDWAFVTLEAGANGTAVGAETTTEET